MGEPGPAPAQPQMKGPGQRPQTRPVGNLPLKALAALSQLGLGVAEGDIWWVPEEHLNYHSGKDGRFCVLVALEVSQPGGPPTRAHLLVCSGRPDFDPAMPEVMLRAGEGGLTEDSFIALKQPSDLDLQLLREFGRWIGRLDEDRVTEIQQEVRTSNLTSICRVLSK